jgi:hypothetical protein
MAKREQKAKRQKYGPQTTTYNKTKDWTTITLLKPGWTRVPRRLNNNNPTETGVNSGTTEIEQQ